MAAPEPVETRRRFSQDLEETEIDPQAFARLGLLNGLLIGLGAVLGLWGLQIYAIRALPLAQKYTSVLLAGVLVLVLCGFVGWLTARLRKTAVTVLLWLGAAILITLIATYQPYQISSFAAWLADTRFWGMSIYPFVLGFSLLVFLGIFLASLFFMIVFVLLSIFQDVRLQSINQERGGNGRLNRRAWTKLLLPIPLFILIGYVTATITANNAWQAIPIVDQVIRTAREYEGDLFALGLEDGINYTALDGVDDQLQGNYMLARGTVNPLSLTTIVVADFDNGAWVNCRFVNDQLNYCYDASPPYTIGLNSLITGKPVPEDCRGCMPDVEDRWVDWLADKGAKLGEVPVISRVGQQGDHVIMRAEAEDGSNAIQCWFNDTPPQLMHCEGAQP